MNYERITKWSDTHTLHVFDINDQEIPLSEVTSLDIDLIAGHLVFLEDKIECGELVDRNEYLDYLMSAKLFEMTDKEIELFVDHKAKIRKYLDGDNTRLIAENSELKARLERSIELPCKPGDTIFYVQYFCDYKGCDSTTRQFCCGCKEMIERERRNEKYVICEKSFELKDFEEVGKKYFTTREAAEARLEELKGGMI